jgi:DNA topoisomerase-3
LVSSAIGSHASKLLKDGLNKPKKGIDAGDHPPITPTLNVPSGLVGDDARFYIILNICRVYNYVASHFLATLSYDAVIENKNITLKLDGNDDTFKLSGTKVISYGYTEVFKICFDNKIMNWITLTNTTIPDLK